MKTLFYLNLLSLLMISCSGSKQTTQSTSSNVDYATYQNKYYKKKTTDRYATNETYRPKNSTVVNSEKVSKTVNKIIEEHTGNPISEIARSNIFRTQIGYEWKFTNVSTGRSYRIITNRNFENVQVKTLSSISDF